MKAGQVYYGHALSHDAEGWSGAFETREAAIADGRSSYGDGVEFWVDGGPAITPSLDVDAVMELIEDTARDDAIWSDEPITFKPGASAALFKAVAPWLREYVQPQAWEAHGVPEHIDPIKSEPEP